MNWNEIKWYFSKEHRLYAHKIYIDLGFHKLWKDWKEASKTLNFEKPKLKWHWGDCGPNDNWCEYYMDIYASYSNFKNKWFAIHIEPLGWRYKFGFYQYQYRPEIVIVLFKKVIATIRLEEPNKDDKCSEYEYWEPIVQVKKAQKKD